MASVAERKFWDEHWQVRQLKPAPFFHPVRQWIAKNIPSGEGKTCFEIGCYPGQFLPAFGEKGYTLHGIDFLAGSSTVLPRALAQRGYAIGEFHEEDFLTYEDSQQYDVVASFGFIEHFDNWQEIIGKHVALAKPGGRVVIEVPNLDSPVYRNLYSMLEPRTLAQHVLPSMHLDALCTSMTAHGCEVEQGDYLGAFYFRFATKPGLRGAALSVLTSLVASPAQLLPKEYRSRYIGVIGRKL
jgi:L-malate glycosyltransferase